MRLTLSSSIRSASVFLLFVACFDAINSTILFCFFPDDGQSNLNVTVLATPSSIFRHMNALNGCDYFVIRSASLTDVGVLEIPPLLKRQQILLKRNTRLFREKYKLLLGIDDKNSATGFSSFVSAERAIQSLEHFMQTENEFDGLWFGPSFLDESSQYFEMFPLIIAKLNSKLKKRNLRHKKKIVIGISAAEHMNLIGGWGQENSAVDLIYLFAASKEKALSLFDMEKPIIPTTSLWTQKEHLVNSKILVNKTIIGLNVMAKCFEHNKMSISHERGVRQFSTVQTCKWIEELGHVFYDQAGGTTILLNKTNIVHFTWPEHETLKLKIDWINREGFLGIGLSSIAMDYDKVKSCGLNFRFPIHETVSNLIAGRSAELIRPTAHSAIVYVPNYNSQNVEEKRDNCDNGCIDSNFNNIKMEQQQTYAIQKSSWHESGLTCPTRSIERHYRSVTSDTYGEVRNGEADDQQHSDCMKICGVRDLKLQPERSSYFRTTGGITLSTLFYPWVVYVETIKQCTHTKPMFMRCTGVLIGMQHVLTAAHCVKWDRTLLAGCLGYVDPSFVIGFDYVNPQELSVFYVSHDLSSAKKSKVAKISVPELFESTQAEPRAYDIAIIYLEFRLDRLRDGVSPICLLENFNALNGEMASTVGFGAVDPLTDISCSGRLMNEVHLPFVSNKYCERMYNDVGVDYSQKLFVCAGSANRGFLSGDCGGPIQIQRNVIFYLIGLTITSFAVPMGRDIMPDAYTKISNYCNYISTNTRSAVSCLPKVYSGEELEEACAEIFSKILFDNYQATCIMADPVTGVTTNICSKPVLPIPTCD